MDFYKISVRSPKRGVQEVYPDFLVCRTKDLMVRGKSFYAVWDEEKGLWSTDEYDVARIVDRDLNEYAKELREKVMDTVVVKSMSTYSSKTWKDFKNYISSIADNSKQLDTKIVFSNTPVEKKDFISRKLDYPLEKGSIESYERMMNVLYSPEERQKLEWAIGAIINGDAKHIQKFLVLYGDPGTGKSTILEIIQKMFNGYYSIFEAKALTNSNNAFSTEQFKSNPLIAIQHDGDLSRIEDNSKLNSVISHEEIVVNEKYKSGYSMRMNCFLFMATNKPVKITDGKAGLIRRLIDVRPTGEKLPPDLYYELIEKIQFELPAIAWHCKEVYEKMGKNYYNTYRPVDMMYKTDPFYNFVEDSYDYFNKEEGVSLKQAYRMYKEYCKDTEASIILQMYKFREELKNYFKNFEDVTRIDGVQIRSYYSGFRTDKFERTMKVINVKNDNWIKLKKQQSLFDDICSDCRAQYATDKESPEHKWNNVNTTLKDIDTDKLHYVMVPENHIVIDFDIKDKDGNKSLEKNLEAAKQFPKTYVETSKSGGGLHLHYLYSGDVNTLSRIYDDNIEVKVFTGNSSLRRKLVKCNDIPIATISSGLPLKELKGEKTVVDFSNMKNEKALRTMIKRNLNKEYHPATKPSVDFIFKILDDAYNSGLHYDVTDMRQAILNFAMKSSNQSDYCIKLVNKMKFKSEEPSLNVDDDLQPIIFYDVEVFPNLLLINWKKEGEGNSVVRMINPSPAAVEELCKYKLVGFNCRRYDNHILYARMLGYSNEQIYKLSQRIVNGKKGVENNGMFAEAYNLSYTDIYDYSTKKQSLKKWEIELGLHHLELGLPWDQPVDESLWEKVAEYCDNDVISTEAVWNATKSDFKARQILVSIAKHAGADACVNDTTNTLTTKIIFGKEKKPNLVYTDLATGICTDERYQRTDIKQAFPGYKYISKIESEDGNRHNMFMDEDAGFGGYVYYEEGMYVNVALLDIASMHPTSIECMNCFGEYTKRFSEIKAARIYIKHKEWDKARSMLDGALAEYLDDEEAAKELSTALKIPINSVYGLTSASFSNPFKDDRNENNIVALRGALFMILLKHEVQKRGFKVAHIKTDSIKIPNATPGIIDFVFNFGKEYGYTFEHEATYEKMCLVNGSTYIAKYSNDDINGDHKGEWTATAAEFQHPFIFKTLFTHEPIEFEDMCETKEVKTALYLDMNEQNEDEHHYMFVGKVGQFCPIKSGAGGGLLVRINGDGTKYDSATGAKGWRWLESETVKNINQDIIDKQYFKDLVDKAYEHIKQYGDAEWFCQAN